MWCLPHPHRDGHTLVLLDTKGLGDAHKGDPKHDTWIFTLAVLLSSTLVYNSQGTIDQDAMSKLHFVFELLEHIKVKADEAKQEEEETAADTEYVSFFPSFIWTLRDFTLDLELEGRQVTEDEYLESTLILKKGRSKEVLSHNLPRQCIREYFPTRKCFVFDRPASNRDIKQLESLPDSALQPKFLEQSRRFCQYVLQESRVKMLKGGHPVTGPMLGLLAQSYVETIMSGKVPCLDEGITSIATKQNEAAVRAGLAHYDAQMEEQVTFPAEVAMLSETHGACERAALQLFMQQSFKDEGQKYQEQLAVAIYKHYSAVLGRNRTASQETCRALLSQLSADVERKLSEGVYMQPGGYQLYVTDQRQVLESFQRAPNKGAMAEQVLQQFMDSKKTEAASILQADKMLSEMEKHQAADQARLEQLEQQRKAEEERRQQLEQQMRDLECSHQENIKQVEAKMKEEAENMKQEMETALQCKLREQEKLLQEGFIEKANLLQEEMEQMRKEAKEQEEKMQQEFLEREKLMKEQMDRRQKEAEKREEKMQLEFLERDKLMKNEMEQLQKEAKERLQQEFLERDKLLKEEMGRRQKEGKEREDKLQQEFLERDKLLKEEMKQLQKEAKEREEKLQQELLQRQRKAEEEHLERQRQHEREEKERQRQWEQFCYEREAKEKERQYQHELKVEKLKLNRQKRAEEALMKREREEKERNQGKGCVPF
ncbi:guanylate-binding protein 3-like [Pelodiscus sinensis]|uniref:guanylate-binding protein 3-like n=1 Tax=Pelodiscus sinensis TaxID=13735 RepID=UPI003F6AD44F